MIESKNSKCSKMARIKLYRNSNNKSINKMMKCSNTANIQIDIVVVKVSIFVVSSVANTIQVYDL